MIQIGAGHIPFIVNFTNDHARVENWVKRLKFSVTSCFLCRNSFNHQVSPVLVIVWSYFSKKKKKSWKPMVYILMVLPTNGVNWLSVWKDTVMNHDGSIGMTTMYTLVSAMISNQWLRKSRSERSLFTWTTECEKNV